MLPTKTGPGQNQDATQVPISRLKSFIRESMARSQNPTYVANGVRAYFGIELSDDQIIAFCTDRTTPTTLAELGQDQAAVQAPAEEAKEAGGAGNAELDAKPAPAIAAAPLNLAPEPNRDANPDRDPDGGVARDKNAVDAKGKSEQATPTDPRQNQNSMQILGDDVQEFIVDCIAHGQATARVIEKVEARFGIVIDGNQVAICWRDRHERAAKSKQAAPLTDEHKEFIVTMLACYEPPSKVAQACKEHFGIEVSRQKVFSYDPACSKRPAQRWIDLHAATRAQFLGGIAEIGVAHKLVRLNMLNRLAFRCERSSVALALTCLDRAAKECGGFYERRRAALAAPQDSPPAAPALEA